jgi:hypothetical protein
MFIGNVQYQGCLFNQKKNQSNAICERMHQTVENVLRTLVYSNLQCIMTQAQDIIDDALATVMHTMQTIVATTIGSTQGALAFAQDLFLNMPSIADWQAIAHTFEHHVSENLKCDKRKQRQYDYAPGQQVMKKVHSSTMLGVRTEGPYTIECVHVNGNFIIILREGLIECINIHIVLPYC